MLIFSIFGFVFLASSVSAETKYKISGYILDSNGHGIAGAEIIFNVPTIVPSDTSDINGYYEMSAPAGTYHVNVWSPFDSSYINYDEPSLVVSSDLPNKNITLQVGCKVSGYILNSTGAPVSGAVVFLNNYGSGYYSNSQGYYFLNVPTGTYTLNVHPKTNAPFNFDAYNEYNFVVNGNITKNITVTGSDKLKVSGYVLDANGHGLAGAEIIFNVPSIVPSVYTDNSGYYQIFAPQDTYHINVWPPYDSNYLSYEEPAFAVNSDVTKNITLNSGYKVYGYITDSFGTPMTGAVVALGSYFSGWYSKSNGYYFVVAPAGTYRIEAHPRTGSFQSPTSNFQTYYENNFVVNGDTFKNITVNTQGTPAATTSPTSQPTQSPITTPQPTTNPLSTTISISIDASSYQVGSTINVNGKLTDQNSNPLNDKTIFLSYSTTNSSNWIEIGSGKTSSTGEYSIEWQIQTAGTITLKVEWAGNQNYRSSSNIATLSFLPYQGLTVFFVESNSTVTGLNFDSNNQVLGFNVSGSTDTSGYTKVTLAKTLAPNATGFKVAIDGRQITYTATSSSDYWILEFTYSHSTHQVTINAASTSQENRITIDASTAILLIAVVISALLVLALVVVKKLHR